MHIEECTQLNEGKTLVVNASIDHNSSEFASLLTKEDYMEMILKRKCEVSFVVA